MSFGSLNHLHTPNITPHVPIIGEQNNQGVVVKTRAGQEQAGVQPAILFIDSQDNYALFDSIFGKHNTSVQVAADKQTAIDFVAKSPKNVPLLIMLTNCSTVELSCMDILDQVESHVLVRILQVSQKWLEPRNRSIEMCLPFRNPCLPIRSFQIPDEDTKLAWEIDEFFEQSNAFSAATSRLQRFSSLNDREMRVAQYVTRGYPNKKISKIESVSEKTIEKWRKELYNKLEVTSAAELVSVVTLRNYLRWPKNVPLAQQG